ncbi:MAG: glycosyltransferase, partial [Anaerolinea sp.]|nr:glycosyltransferase [Anaerolinea sp.]
RIHFSHRLEHTVLPAEVAQADVVVTGRNSEPIFRAIYDLAVERGIPIVSEVDDYLFDLPDVYPERELYRSEARRAYMQDLLRRSALVRVYSPRLRELLADFNPRIELVRAAVDWTLAPAHLPSLAEPLKLVYATSRREVDVIFPQIAGDLRRLLDDFGDRIRLHFLGYQPPEFRGRPGVIMEPFQPDYAAYFAAFTRAGYAIGFAPMLPGDFYMSKSNNKFREYAAAGAVGIYLDCPVYRGEGGVIDGETGLLVSGEPGSWYAAAAALIADRARLLAIRERAYTFARQTYTLEAVAATWLAHLEALPIPERGPTADLPQKWWFTRTGPEPAGLRRRLRDWYRASIPMAWRLRFREWRYALASRLRRTADI